MSSFRNPVGGQPAAVYWRRRAIVGGALLLVIVVVLLIVFGHGGGSEAAPAPSASASRTASAHRSSSAAERAAARAAAADAAANASSRASAAATAAATAIATPEAGATAGATSAPAAGSAKNGATCRKSQITLKALTDKTQYGPTEEPKISMSITNTASTSCHMDLGSSQQVLTITSGTETYWSSKDCQTGGTDQDITIKGGQTLTTPAITWDRTRSSTSTCDSSRPSVTAGGASYHLSVAVGNITSATSTQFVLQ
ncbi:hypothetical protein [Curtobacterium sp. MCBD17_003]|uniref:hypothetical protein n=1 Tax=Curtobacterium sp. MCBD17_003 TaxID=2175667 RepID=UPI000DA95197|nr:hypothetical protein [Curtobacterium sp. MCBD17_003]WIE54746.1 hypothetical protein DEI88_000650 [Curtobacterium sp. MCBD17_003]